MQLKNQKQISPEEIGDLSNEELELIHVIRNHFRWGPIQIEVKNGKPFRILKAYVTHAIGVDDPMKDMSV